MIICILYRPPEAPLASFKPVLETISSYISGHVNYDLCLLGDFNFPCIDWNTLSIIPGATSIPIQCMETFFDFIADHLLSQYILEPTRKDNMVSGQFTPGQFTPGQFTPGQFTPRRFSPRYTLPLTIDLKIITRCKLSLGRTIYPGNSPRNNSPWDNLPRDNSPRVIFCLLL